MDQSFPTSDTLLIAKPPPSVTNSPPSMTNSPLPAANSPPPPASSLAQLASIVRGLTAELLCASDTRIIKIAAENNGGWSVEAEVFAPNPELTVSLRGDKAILERRSYRLHFNLGLQLVALEPVEE
jgi:hypothetical protein